MPIQYAKEELETLFRYDSETGTVTRLTDGTRHKKGDRVSYINTKGYLIAKIKGYPYLLHRIIWVLAYGCWPKNEIDHINGVRTDNKLGNLREVTGAENQQNRRLSANNTSGCVGVTWNKKHNAWQAQIKANGEYMYLGSFSELDDAIAVREAANKKYKFHPNHGNK